MKGHNLKTSVGYFVSNQVNKRLDPNICVIDGICNIKERSTLHIHVANYTNQHVMFNKGQFIGHKVPSNDHISQTTINNFTMQKILDEHIQPDTLTSHLHTLLDDVMKSLNQLLETFKS